MYPTIEPKEIKLHKTLGYEYFLDKNHPLASGAAGFVYYHRHLVSISIGRWLNKNEIVHHKDENKSNNNLSNLELTTLHEHMLIHGIGSEKLKDIKCLNCATIFKPNNSSTKFCSRSCYSIYSIKDSSLTKEVLEPLIWEIPYSTLGKLLGYSDNEIKKRARSLGCIMPPARFHSKYLTKQDKLKQYKTALLVK